METKNINFQFKILYFFGILFVVIGHCNIESLNIFANFFHYYSFHLGLFVFGSGYFFNKSVINHPFKYILKKFKSLIIPLYVWNFIYGIIIQITRIQHFSIGEDLTLYNLFISPITNGHQFVYNLGSWFIIPLFCILMFNLLINKLFKKINNSEYYIFFIYLILGIIGVNLSLHNYNTNWWLPLVRFLFFLPFFSLGILYKEKLEKRDKLSNLKFFLIIFIIQLLIITLCKKNPYYTVAWCNDFGNIYLPYIIGLTGIAFWLRISRILTPILKNSKIIMIIANNTFSIMMHHLLGFMILKTIFAGISKFTIFFTDFDWISYKTSIWYYFFPSGILNWGIVYIIFGIAFSLIIKYISDKIIIFIKKKFSNIKVFIKCFKLNSKS